MVITSKTRASGSCMPCCRQAQSTEPSPEMSRHTSVSLSSDSERVMPQNPADVSVFISHRSLRSQSRPVTLTRKEALTVFVRSLGVCDAAEWPLLSTFTVSRLLRTSVIVFARCDALHSSFFSFFFSMTSRSAAFTGSCF
jgi:hypothetical protein